MTRLIWHGADPRMKSGYARVGRMFVPRIVDHGWDVAVSAVEGTTGRVDTWRAGRREIPVYPRSEYEQFGQDVIRGHVDDFGADLVFTMTCTWVLIPPVWRDIRAVHITPVDVEGMSVRDLHVITETRNTPAAVCRWGEAQMKARGLDPVLYLPHAVDSKTFRPPKNRKQLRQVQGLDGLFVVGVCAINQEKHRKNLDEILRAFALFHMKRPKSVLLLHTLPRTPDGIDLDQLIVKRGLAGKVAFSDGYKQLTGTLDDTAMAAWYGCLDVLIQVGNEGFGLPTLEAMACGTPVVAGDWGPHPELAGGTGWLVPSDPYRDVDYNGWHRADWRIPDVRELAAALESAAWGEAADRRTAARRAALAWDADRMWEEHWMPVIKELEGLWRHTGCCGTTATISGRAAGRMWMPPTRRTPRGRPRWAPGRAACSWPWRKCLIEVTDLWVLVPSRGRPANVERLVRTCALTCQADTRLHFGFDEDDPHLQAVILAAGHSRYTVRPRMGLAAWTNHLTEQHIMEDCPAYASLGDDHVPVTHGWDALLLAAIEKEHGGIGIAYPDDKIRDDIPEAVVMSAAIPRALGWMANPACEHFYIDDTWRDLGAGAGCMTFCHDVIVEHRHWIRGADKDATYADADSRIAPDAAAYRRWRLSPGGMKADVAKIRALREAAGLR